MSVLVNLLPDLRLKRQRDKQRRQLATTISIIVMSVCGAFIVIMIIVTSGQSALISSAKNDIVTKKAKLSSMEGLMPALSAQARLKSLSSLYSQRNLMTKLISVFSEVSPTTMQINSFKFDQAENKIEIAGITKTYAEAAKLDRALEAAHVTIGSGTMGDPYFTDVILGTVDKSTGRAVEFTLSATVAPGAINAE